MSRKRLTDEERAARRLERLEYQKRWRAKHRVHIRAYNRQWRESNRDKVKASDKRRYPKARARHDAWLAAHPGKRAEYSRRYREKHRKAIREREKLRSRQDRALKKVKKGELETQARVAWAMGLSVAELKRVEAEALAKLKVTLAEWEDVA